jgi:paraquat-inducible protein B
MHDSSPAEPAATPNGPPTDDLPELLIEQRRGFSLVWLIPLVAALIGLWLVYKTLSEEGPRITIHFKDAAGLEAGKTKIMYKSVQVGLVETVHLNADLSTIEVHASFQPGWEKHLGEQTKFWVVRPRVGLSGISGLETLVSGSYIAVEPVDGGLSKFFEGLEQPPDITADTPGRKFVLLTPQLGSIQNGTPIYFRDLTAGEVVGYQLAEDKQSVVLDVFIHAPYHLLVRDHSRFWKASGFDVSLSATGINVRMESLLALVAGGIAFDTPPPNDAASVASLEGTRFPLYSSFASISESAITKRSPFLVYFDSSVRGLSVGAPVEFRGIKVGVVTDLQLKLDPTTNELKIPVVIELEPQRWQFPPQYLQEYMQGVADGRRPIMEKLVERGMRAQLQTGSLLTGQLFVDLDMYPDSPPKQLVYGGIYPEIPSLPSTLDQAQQTVTMLLADLRKLPLDQIADALLKTLQGTSRLANGPELAEAVRTLSATLKDLQKLAGTLDRKVTPLAANLEETLKGADKALTAVRTTLEIAEPGSPVAVDLAGTLEELATAARSIRVLSDYLARHPEALIYGKGGPTGTGVKQP